MLNAKCLKDRGMVAGKGRKVKALVNPYRYCLKSAQAAHRINNL